MLNTTRRKGHLSVRLYADLLVSVIIVHVMFYLRFVIQCVPEKRKSINQLNFSENYDLWKTNQFLFFLLTPNAKCIGRARIISNGDVKIYLHRIGG